MEETSGMREFGGPRGGIMNSPVHRETKTCSRAMISSQFKL